VPAFACRAKLFTALWTAQLSRPYSNSREESCTTAWVGTLAQDLFVAAVRFPLLSTGRQETVPKSGACYGTLNLQCRNFTTTARHRAAELLRTNAFFTDMNLQKSMKATGAEAMQTVHFYRFVKGLVTLKTKWASEACSLYLRCHLLVVLLLEPPGPLLISELQLLLFAVATC